MEMRLSVYLGNDHNILHDGGSKVICFKGVCKIADNAILLLRWLDVMEVV